jgi:hypothetical protein
VAVQAQLAEDVLSSPNHKAGWHAVPTRHGVDLEASRAMAARLRLFIKGDPEPGARDWNALGQALWRGDLMADAVIDWMQQQGMGKAWPLFERAMVEGAGVLPPDAAPLTDFLLLAGTLPPWLDQRKLMLGAKTLQSTGLHGMMVLRDAGLMAGYQASAINQTLLKTGALHRGSHRRVAETSTWWLACTELGGMASDRDGFKITLRVRLAHALVRRQVSQLPDWDAGKLGVPINQVDMQATYLAFGVVQLLALRLTGVLISSKESDAVMHLWRYVGWLMGVDEDMMCDTESEGRVLLYRNLISQAPADDTSVVLARALMDEPLHREYPWGARWWGWFNKARHQSLVKWFIGRRGMKNLGLPMAWPWYPVLMFWPMMLRSSLLRTMPWLRPLWRQWARRQQTHYLGTVMGVKPLQHVGIMGKQARL